jgi:hypothetical protein
MSNPDNTMGLVLLLLLLSIVYFLPTMVAVARSRAVGPVFLLNLFLGWTLLGWVAALVWSATENTQRELDRIEASKALPPHLRPPQT